MSKGVLIQKGGGYRLSQIENGLLLSGPLGVRALAEDGGEANDLLRRYVESVLVLGVPFDSWASREVGSDTR